MLDNKMVGYTILYYIVLVFGLLLGLYTIGQVANFFGIGFQYYGVYLFFGIAIGILYFVLPGNHRNIFA